MPTLGVLHSMWATLSSLQALVPIAAAGSARAGAVAVHEMSDDDSGASTETLSCWSSSSDDEMAVGGGAGNGDVAAGADGAGSTASSCQAAHLGSDLLCGLWTVDCTRLTNSFTSAGGLDNDNSTQWEACHPVAGVPPAGSVRLPAPLGCRAASIAARVMAATGSNQPPPESLLLDEQDAVVQVCSRSPAAPLLCPATAAGDREACSAHLRATCRVSAR